jgi:hypothetical protein
VSYSEGVAATAKAIGTKAPLLLLSGLFLLLLWLGNAAVLVYESFGYGFGDDVTLDRLVSQVFAVGLVDVVATFFTAPFFGWVNLAMLVTLVAMGAAEVLTPRRATAIRVAVVVLSVPLAALALWSAIESARLGLDGEWLAEGWPILQVFFVWTIALSVYALAQSGLIRRP